MKAQLQITDGPLAGQTVELGRLGSFTIGRQRANDLSIIEKAVSRKHSRIDYDGELFWLVDCDSHNGTLVNSRKITKCLLYDGDVINIGHSRLVFVMPEEEPKDTTDL